MLRRMPLKKWRMQMITIARISDVEYRRYDEVWAIVRSLKYGNPRIKHVPELSPSWSLFRKYREMVENGEWNDEAFRRIYVPRFLKEMHEDAPRALLNELIQTKKNISCECGGCPGTIVSISAGIRTVFQECGQSL